MPVQIARPRGSGPFKLILLYMDGFGLRQDLYEAASRMADAGYLVALPNLFYRLAPGQRPDPARLAAGDENEFARMAAAVRSVEDAAVVADTRAMIDQLAATLPIDEQGWVCVGFCMGGRFGLRAAAEFGEAVRAGSLLHPSGLVTDSPDSPHRRLGGVRANLYFGFGANDHVSPPSTIPPLQEALDRNHITYRIDVLPEADHGFMMPNHPAYNRDAAEHAWKETLDLLRRAVPASG
jgi:carboxymethylenebutenolidase